MCYLFWYVKLLRRLPLSVAVQLGQFHRSLGNLRRFTLTTNKRIKLLLLLFKKTPNSLAHKHIPPFGSLVKDNPNFIWSRRVDVLSRHVQSTYGHLTNNTCMPRKLIVKVNSSDLPSQICINNKNDKIIHGIFPSIMVEKFPAFQVGLLVEIHPLLSSRKNKCSETDGDFFIKSAGKRRSQSRIILRSSATAAVILG